MRFKPTYYMKINKDYIRLIRPENFNKMKQFRFVNN